MDEIKKLFPQFSTEQMDLFSRLPVLYEEWNEKINVISRKDMDHFVERHVLHSLSIALYYKIPANTTVLDIGTGGGFPGIPLAIAFPETQFVLVDSIGKKTRVVQEVATALGLTNVTVRNERVENLDVKFHFIVSRAVAPLSQLIGWTRKHLIEGKTNHFEHGYICIKGGDLKSEIKESGAKCKVHQLDEKFKQPFFETKKLIYISASSLSKMQRNKGIR